MKKYKYDVSFRVRHPSMDPDLICSTLGLEAKSKWKAGSERKTPKGKPLLGKYEFSFCTFSLKHPKDIHIADFLKFYNKKLNKQKYFLNSVRVSGGSLEYFIGWYTNENCGEVFDVELLKNLVDLGIEISLDIYPAAHSK